MFDRLGDMTWIMRCSFFPSTPLASHHYGTSWSLSQLCTTHFFPRTLRATFNTFFATATWPLYSWDQLSEVVPVRAELMIVFGTYKVLELLDSCKGFFLLFIQILFLLHDGRLYLHWHLLSPQTESQQIILNYHELKHTFARNTWAAKCSTGFLKLGI